MSSIAVRQTYEGVPDNHAWVYGDIGQQASRASITLDVSKFTKATHFPKGFIPSGTVLGRITATGKYGPYDNTATDGRETAAGFLWAYTDIRDGQAESVVALWFGPGAIQENKLPRPIDAAGKTDLANWFKFFGA